MGRKGQARGILSFHHPNPETRFLLWGGEGSELSYPHGLAGGAVLPWWVNAGLVLLHSGLSHFLPGRCEMKRRLCKVAFLVETPIGLKVHSKELTNVLLFYLSEIALGSLYLEFVLLIANEATEWFEYHGWK